MVNEKYTPSKIGLPVVTPRLETQGVTGTAALAADQAQTQATPATSAQAATPQVNQAAATPAQGTTAAEAADTSTVTPEATTQSAGTGIVSSAVQDASREAYLASLDKLLQENGAKGNDALKYQIQLYEEQLRAQQAALDAEKAANEAQLDSEAERIAAQGYENRRQSEADSAKARANWNETANAYGLNSGTQGQAALSFSNQLQSDLNALRTLEEQERAEIERQRLTLGQQYQAAIEQAQAENNQQLVQLLYEQALKADSSIQGGSYSGSYSSSSGTRKRTTSSDRVNDLASMITGEPFTDFGLLNASDQKMINDEMMARGGSLEEMTEFLYNRVYPTLVNRAGKTSANGDSITNLVDTIVTNTGRTDFDRFYEWEPEEEKTGSKTSSSASSSSKTNTGGTSGASKKSSTGGYLKPAYDVPY